jgi:hypothetical protein
LNVWVCFLKILAGGLAAPIVMPRSTSSVAGLEHHDAHRQDGEVEAEGRLLSIPVIFSRCLPCALGWLRDLPIRGGAEAE